MATAEHQHITDNTIQSDASMMRFAIAVSDWYFEDITGPMLDGALRTLKDAGVADENIVVRHVPGSFELIFAANQLADKLTVDAVIVLGCVVRGDTPHFDYVCQAVTQGIAHLNTVGDVPVVFGLLTTETKQQALDRSSGKLGNKGEECAYVAIKMVDLVGSFNY